MDATIPTLEIEETLWQAGYQLIVGMDEAGRGALAGPVAVGAVILPAAPASLRLTLSGVRDSKQLPPPERKRWAQQVQQVAVTWAVGFASAAEIDRWGIVTAVRLAALRALAQLNCRPEILLTDFRLDLPMLELPQISLIDGDALALSVAAASLLAKTGRDAYLEQLDRLYPGYGLARHKGYATAQHRAALRELGPSPFHRHSFLRMDGEG